jgi:hypothetical protein
MAARSSLAASQVWVLCPASTSTGAPGRPFSCAPSRGRLHYSRPATSVAPMRRRARRGAACFRRRPSADPRSPTSSSPSRGKRWIAAISMRSTVCARKEPVSMRSAKPWRAERPTLRGFLEAILLWRRGSPPRNERNAHFIGIGRTHLLATYTYTYTSQPPRH